MAFQIVLLSCLLASAWADSTAEGFKDPRVIGGQNAAYGQFPHQVSLQTGFGSRHFCGGSIINRYWVLTAAHCIVTNSIVVKAGKHNIHLTESTEQTISVAKIMKHESYAGEVGPYDIALLKLSSPLTFNQYVKAIALPGRNVEPVGLATLSGWGSTSRTNNPSMPSILQWVNLNLMNANVCYRTYTSINTFTASKIHASNVCTSAGSAGLSACSGDSGGPLIITNSRGVKEVIGVVSWGMIPCGGAAPSVYTKVSSFIDWIENKMLYN